MFLNDSLKVVDFSWWNTDITKVSCHALLLVLLLFVCWQKWPGNECAAGKGKCMYLSAACKHGQAGKSNLRRRFNYCLCQTMLCMQTQWVPDKRYRVFGRVAKNDAFENFYYHSPNSSFQQNNSLKLWNSDWIWWCHRNPPVTSCNFVPKYIKEK